MTPMNPHETQRPGNSTLVTGLTIGLAIGLTVSCLGSGLGYVYVKRAAVNARKGWNLVPVVVAAVDIQENTVVTMEMISQRSVPEQFVTASIVQPADATTIINQKTLVPMLAGDPLLWTHFGSKPKKTE